MEHRGFREIVLCCPTMVDTWHYGQTPQEVGLGDSSAEKHLLCEREDPRLDQRDACEARQTQPHVCNPASIPTARGEVRTGDSHSLLAWHTQW